MTGAPDAPDLAQLAGTVEYVCALGILSTRTRERMREAATALRTGEEVRRERDALRAEVARLRQREA